MTGLRTIADLPGPRGLPLVGNAFSLLRTSQIHLVAEEWSRRYGPMIRIKAGGRLVVGVADGDAIGEILRDRPQGFRRWRDQQSVIEEIGGSGVFTAEGEDWKRQRRLIVTALNTNHLHRYFDVVRTCTGRLHRRLLETACDGRSLEIGDELTSYTVDVTSALALGHDLNTLERRDNELQGHIQRVLQMTARRLGAPAPYWRWFRLPADRALDRSVVAMNRAIERFVDEAKSRIEARPELEGTPSNLLEGMLAAQREDGTFTDEEIVANVFTVLLAGEDTTANTLAWTIWLLASRPDLQARLGAEADEVLGGEAFPVAYETIERLAYAEAVLRESMRLKSVTPLMGVEPVEDTTICDTRIPAGTRLLLLLRQASLTAAGRSAEFYPERWLEEREDARAPKRSPSAPAPVSAPVATSPFSSRRSCWR